jgi:hypothetical protein
VGSWVETKPIAATGTLVAITTVLVNLPGETNLASALRVVGFAFIGDMGGSIAGGMAGALAARLRGEAIDGSPTGEFCTKGGMAAGTIAGVIFGVRREMARRQLH